MGFYQEAAALLLVGNDVEGNECQVIASPIGLHLVFRIVKVEERHERRRVGFRGETAEQAR